MFFAIQVGRMIAEIGRYDHAADFRFGRTRAVMGRLH
jgi:hypothetical protein